MSTKFTSCFYDIGEVLCKNKMISYNNNINAGSSSVPLLDRKAVGTPTLMDYQRRHSVALVNANSKFNQNQLLNSFKLEQSGTTAGANKENKFRDRSFSETGLQKAQSQVNSSRYKTELCRPFEENGSCKYGDKCQFAHGIHELRSLARHPKYKTELCRTFHTIGFCPYGPRCHFIHNAEERRLSPVHDQQHLPLSSSNKIDRPRLQHSYSFSGISSSSSGLLGSPTSITPPPIFSSEDLSSSPTLPDCASNPFTYSSQELPNLFAPSIGIQVPMTSVNNGTHSPSFLLRSLAESPHLYEPPPSPPDSMSDSYLSSSGSVSGSESPTPDLSKRLPIFSRLSISDD
ncbi:mRNA decay activator protein ZFP36L1a isoform X1 [Rhincodon typus]|uniref:mRNA decay activator protein ZFP36L1a isoform X1 n=2 Tax=Rhincodon typus TaxID=259920 RepID=UPI0009A33ECE|nr:mRNA decay activator protein ZFP36L1a isoform X1 [Rhincodon typus]